MSTELHSRSHRLPPRRDRQVSPELHEFKTRLLFHCPIRQRRRFRDTPRGGGVARHALRLQFPHQVECQREFALHHGRGRPRIHQSGGQRRAHPHHFRRARFGRDFWKRLVADRAAEGLRLRTLRRRPLGARMVTQVEKHTATIARPSGLIQRAPRLRCGHPCSRTLHPGGCWGLPMDENAGPARFLVSMSLVFSTLGRLVKTPSRRGRCGEDTYPQAEKGVMFTLRASLDEAAGRKKGVAFAHAGKVYSNWLSYKAQFRQGSARSPR